MENTWPKGKRQPLSWQQHEDHNRENYPGTRQLCFLCDNETGRCEEDSLIPEKIGHPTCEECFDKEKQT